MAERTYRYSKCTTIIISIAYSCNTVILFIRLLFVIFENLAAKNPKMAVSLERAKGKELI